MENVQNFGANLFCKNIFFHFHVPHIGFHKHSRLIFIFDLLYTAIAHEVLPVSLVDSVTAKVDDEKKNLHTIYTCGMHHVVYLLYTLYMHFINMFDMFFIYILYTSHTH